MTTTRSISISLNGDARTLAEGATVADLIAELGLAGAMAVEVNRCIVPKAQHAQHLLEAGDQVEVVTIVGGG